MTVTETRPAGSRADGRTAMTRASDARPFKPYVYRGGDVEPPAAIAARERWRAREAEIERIRAQAAAEVMPDPGPGWEWYRELAEDQELAELAGTRDRYQAAMAAVPEPRVPDPAPAPPPRYGARALPSLQVPDDLGRTPGGVR